MMTLTQYLQSQASAELASTIDTLAKSSIAISALLDKGALAGIHGETGNENVQGEAQKKLDVISNDLLLDALTQNPHCAGVASEELDEISPANDQGTLLVTFDPLDGSSNIDINMTVGTIFSILPHPRVGSQATEADFLQPGVQQVAAGYFIYGTSTMLAMTLGQGVVMFSFDPTSQEYLLINDQVTISQTTAEYAINASNYRYWLDPIKEYIDGLVAGDLGVRNKDYNMRWVAAMIADVHRILIRGGVFMYPFDTKIAGKAGKLRLMYEANPMSFIIEQAGGASTDGVERIMEIQPSHIHQRIPVVLGAKEEVDYVKDLHAKAGILANGDPV
ncbi:MULTISPECIES: class 1 fructose-bisphosphatase [Moraxella]|uniref:Fructose-1,6-bisphosphatase class 1 n=1 Tax=Moraxella catarrhalis TaxID=480 RepID=A0A7Z0UZ01_MORCA|nr:class 1 fructose-bisphosphatase [Moraxella catarrhalis]OAV00793.1 Fructose-1,6-bisphosphatase, type I [Moraxella catarrhalis]STY81271.1 Fructose-1,6-bisphosphatase class 1 [Moraxella catarrhalis]